MCSLQIIKMDKMVSMWQAFKLFWSDFPFHSHQIIPSRAQNESRKVCGYDGHANSFMRHVDMVLFIKIHRASITC